MTYVQDLGLKVTGAVYCRFTNSPITKGYGTARGSGRTAGSRVRKMVVVFRYAWLIVLLGTVGALSFAAGYRLADPGLPPGWAVVSGPARVIDGDTVEIDGVRIRLHGLDAPERYQRCLTTAGEEYRCGARAGTALRSMLIQQSVSSSCSDTRIFDCGVRRWLSKVLGSIRRSLSRLAPLHASCPRTTVPSGTEIPTTVVCLTHTSDRWGRRIARCFTEEADINRWLVQNGHALAYRRYSREYEIDEAYALEQRRGLWSGRFVAPRDWRRGVRMR